MVEICRLMVIVYYRLGCMPIIGSLYYADIFVFIIIYFMEMGCIYNNLIYLNFQRHVRVRRYDLLLWPTLLFSIIAHFYSLSAYNQPISVVIISDILKLTFSSILYCTDINVHIGRYKYNVQYNVFIYTITVILSWWFMAWENI